MPRANLTPAAVIATAMTLADRDGFDTVTVTAVAGSLGVQPASLYEHVRGRDGLLEGMHRVALGELGALTSDAIAGRSGGEALRHLADAHRTYARERPGAWIALQRPASEQLAQSAEAQTVASLLLAVIRGYPVPADAVVHAARLVGATVNGFLALASAESFSHRPEDEDASWTAAIDSLDRALQSWPAASIDAVDR